MHFPEKTAINYQQGQYKTMFLQQKALSVEVRKEIQNNFEKITLTNDLRKGTLAVESGKVFNDILVFEYLLKDKKVSDKLLSEIDEMLPKYVLHILRYEDEAQFVVTYKEVTSSNKIKVVKIYHSEWGKYNEMELTINGWELDAIYNSFIEQVSGGEIKISENTSIKEVVEKNIDKENILKQIALIEKKMRNEKQVNKQYALRTKLIDLKNKLEQI